IARDVLQHILANPTIGQPYPEQAGVVVRIDRDDHRLGETIVFRAVFRSRSTVRPAHHYQFLAIETIAIRADSIHISAIEVVHARLATLGRETLPTPRDYRTG